MTLGIGIGGGIQIGAPSVDKSVTDVLLPLVINHCLTVLQIEAELDGIISCDVEGGLAGKTYILQLRLKCRVGNIFVIKIVLVKIFWALNAIPLVVSFEYLEEINI